MSHVGRIGRYNGVDYRQQRICDVLCIDVRARWYFAYINDKPTGDHYETLAKFKASVDSGHFDDYINSDSENLAQNQFDNRVLCGMIE